jgi:uncharacterized protein (TIRG00374 family)
MSDVRRRAVVLAGFVISAVALFLVLQTIDLAQAVDVIGNANPVPLVAIVGVVAVQVALRAVRWSLLLPDRPEGGRIPFQRLIPPLLVGYLGNAILPARLGEPMRAVIASRTERVGVPESLGSVLVERVVDVATLAPIAFIAALLVDAPPLVTQVLGIVAVGGITIVLVLTTIGVMPLVKLADGLGLSKRPRIRQLIARFADSLGGPSRRPAILVAVGISSAAWLLDATSFWLAATAVEAGVSYPGAMLIDGVSVLGTAVPSAPGYVGTFELAGAGMAGALGVAAAPAFALTLLVHVMTLAPLAIGGAISVVAMGASLGELADAAAASSQEPSHRRTQGAGGPSA